MQGYGPITVVSGTVVGQTVDQSANRILLSNRSIYDVLVSFQVAQPVPSSVLSPVWPIVVHAGDQVIYTLRNEDTTPTPLGSYWQGNVWLCATTQQPGLALGGTGSNSAQFWVTALHPGDPTPTLAARHTWVDQSSQARVLSIPVTAESYFIQTHSLSGASIFGTNFFFSQTNGPKCYVYLHWLTCTIAATGVNVDFQIGPVGYDAGGNIINNSFFPAIEWQPIGPGTFTLPLLAPHVVGLNFGAVFGSQVLTQAGYMLNVRSVSASTFFSTSAGLTFDTHSQQSVGPIGIGSANFGNPIF